MGGPGLKRTAETGAPFIHRLSASDRDHLLAEGRQIRLRPGSTGLIEGQVSGQVLLLLGGHVRVFSSAADGRESLLAIRRPGDLVGELSAIDGRPHAATVCAMDNVEAVVIPASSFRSFLATHPDATLAVLELITQRLRDADRKRAEFGSTDATGRVAARIAELAERHGHAIGEATQIDLSMSQEELATWASVSREAVSRALRLFRERGWIVSRRRVITVLDLDALLSRAT
jgi:CRP/FNR family transcriptional regulator, cyclic AMP receptor protein